MKRKPHKPVILSFLFPITRSTILILSMASLLSLSLCIFLSLFLSSSNAQLTPSLPVLQACKATRFPLICHTTLSSVTQTNPDPTPVELVQSAINSSYTKLHDAITMISSLYEDSIASNRTRATAAKTCIQILRYSRRRTFLAADAVPRNATKDARAWLSASLAYQYGCWSSLKYANDTLSVAEAMVFVDSLTYITSNALSMVASYDLFGNDTASWRPPLTERNGFWEPPVASGGFGSAYKLGVPSKLTPDATVCKNGDGCYRTVQEAVHAAPDNLKVGERMFVIYIKEGVYEEKVRVPPKKKNVVFLGDGMGKTIITGSRSVGLMPGMSTYHSATVGVLGDGFMAKDLTIQNTAGADAHQAVAFRSDSDLSVIENCEFIGNQDTLYAQTLRQFYKNCRIIGNVDFIFGNSASIFQDCEILVKPRIVDPEKGETNAITAQGRTDPGQSTGFVFWNCSFNGTEEYMALYHSKPQAHKNYLGRPWKEYARTVFINSTLEALIAPEGWMPWSGDFALLTLYYGEFENSGPGSNLAKRVPWSSRIPSEHVDTYSAQNFIQGTHWIPSSL
ncbi:probable pectinesterase/pectinesterase inhibitor 51 [Arachis stenosperma]|uniref:probable pectinesterase/pectinesterase inhibitor 51 n=1 Tax=Arachis stenosperma TaxID=217475 RepID=UPI0025AC9598|nr:probable pectinesterase/pectinesterase inhibitor 51 [Arachis stenosperma]